MELKPYFHKCLKTIAAIVVALPAQAVDAAPPDDYSGKPLRPVTAAYTLEAGSSQLVNTYLTPLRYNGIEAAFRYERMQAMRFNPEKWVMRLTASIKIDRTENPAKNAEMWRANAEATWGMTHRWKLPYNITLAAGGSVGANIGAIYNQRNGNNPVAVEAALTLNITGYATWKTHIGRLPLTLRYQPIVPLTGIFFSPDYGELFYEIYLGNDKGLIHGAWWGNYFRMENLLTADLHLGATALRIGMAQDLLSTKVNNITTELVSWRAIVGISGEWLSIKPGKGLDKNARIISALY
ncbi:DUF3316 domain-containing protein [Muribaculum caecicola]|uniref:DUF3316 domain-containing protein n=1 Tax=Muribaculum caecicola TaxID=3038144 RepID=A0AC61S5A9_9BACT|nr:DUF3316 domain-containing protein [Muribaculum caecicola]THG49524.1 DUF3316 domain-containing protein [Muribaculum caecicola]